MNNDRFIEAEIQREIFGINDELAFDFSIVRNLIIHALLLLIFSVFLFLIVENYINSYQVSNQLLGENSLNIVTIVGSALARVGDSYLHSLLNLGITLPISSILYYFIYSKIKKYY